MGVVIQGSHTDSRLKYIDIIASSALLDDFVQNFLDEYKCINPKKYELIRKKCLDGCICCDRCTKSKFDKAKAVAEILPRDSYKELGLENENLYSCLREIRDIRNSVAHRGAWFNNQTSKEKECSKLTDKILTSDNSPFEHLDGLSIDKKHDLFEKRFSKLRKLMEIEDYDNPEIQGLLFGVKGDDDE